MSFSKNTVRDRQTATRMRNTQVIRLKTTSGKPGLSLSTSRPRHMPATANLTPLSSPNMACTCRWVHSLCNKAILKCILFIIFVFYNNIILFYNNLYFVFIIIILFCFIIIVYFFIIIMILIIYNTT